jgi:hypothetical protein
VDPSGNNLFFKYKETILFYGPDGIPTAGLGANGIGHLSYPGFPDLPVATYQGDGFGNASPGGKRIPIDSEGIVLNADGSFWISDEYGPYIYRFSPARVIIGAIRPPDAIIPIRNGTESFFADSPTFYASKGAGDDVIPATILLHGFVGFTIDGNNLYFLLQVAANQEGGLNKQN